MKMLRIGNASIYLKMRENETQDEAVDRLLDMTDNIGIDIIGWSEESVEEDDDGVI